MNKQCLSCSTIIRETFYWTKLVSFSIFRKNLFPPANEWLCKNCQQEIEVITDPKCSLCSRPLANLAERYIHDYKGSQVCYDCLRWLEWTAELGQRTVLSSNKSVITYNPFAQHLISRYKFRGDEQLKYFLASLLIGLDLDQRVLNKIDLVTCVPLSSQRLKERGFNQAAQLAQLFAQHYRLPYVENLLLRLADDDEKQSKKGRAERLADLLQKFIKNPEQMVDIDNKHILLIDDIYTTGATLHAAAYTLIKAGAREVHSLTVAR